MAGTFEDLDKARAAPASFEALDTAGTPRKPSLDAELSGGLSTLTRSIPFLDEINDGIFALGKAAVDAVQGKPGQLQNEFAAARARSKASADDFVTRRPVVGNLTKGAGLALTAVPALATGGAALAPDLLVADAGAPAASRGLMSAVKHLTKPAAKLAGASVKSGTVGGLTAAVSGLADDGTLQQRVDEGNSAIIPGATLGLLIPGAAATGSRLVNAVASMFAPSVEKEAATAGQILAARTPEAANAPTLSAGTPAPTDGLLPFERMGGGGKSLARAVAAVPGPGKDIAERVLSGRQAQASARMLRSTSAALGDDGAGFHPTLEALDKQRLVESNPQFAEAFAKEPVTSDRLQDLSRRPSVQDAIKRAFSLAMEEGKSPRGLGLFHMEDPAGWASETPPARAPSEAERVFESRRLDANSSPDAYTSRPEPQTEPVYGEIPTPQAWHYVKRGLDDLIESKRDPVTGKLPRTDEMRTWDQTRRSLRSELTSLNPEYGAALKTYSGPSRQIDALQLGRRIASGKMDPEDIAARGEIMSADERDALRLGISRGLADQFRSGNPQAAFRRFANDGVAQDRLRAGFGDDDAYHRFMSDIEAEVRAQKSHNDILAGSRTTPLREDIDAANAAAENSPAVQVATRWAGGQSLKSQALAGAIRNWERVRQPGLNNPEVSRLLGEALFESGNPHSLLNAMVGQKVITPEEVQAVLPYLAVGGGEVSAQRAAR